MAARWPIRHYLAATLMAYGFHSAAVADELTIDRLFDAPALAGPLAAGLKVSPDGSRVTFLRGKTSDKDRMDLWEYNIQDARIRLLVDADTLHSGRELLSDEEAGRRERQRTAALSGILEYSFSPTGGAILFPIGGDLFFYDLTTSPDAALRKVDHAPGFATDASISTRAGYVSYIINQNLYVYDLPAHKEKALTRDGGGVIKNGMAEFVAQEEMGRSTGYWWSPDEQHIAYARVDESPVTPTERFEIAADNVATFAQRYPAAGGRNVTIRIGVVDVRRGRTKWIDLGPEQDFYVARVDWLPDGKTLAIQRESRDQRRLDLLFADISTGHTRIVLTETSDSWIELNNELTFLRQRPEFIWASMRDGFTHLYLYDYAGRVLRRLTAGQWNVDDFHSRAVKAVDETTRSIYFTATERGPTERHLYRTSLDTDTPNDIERLSTESGIHSVSLAPDARFYVDAFTSVSQPPEIRIHSINGGVSATLLENKLDDTHPDAPFFATNSTPEFGVLAAADGQALHYRIFKPPHFDSNRRYPAIIDVYGGPGVQRVLNAWTGASFTQILTRAGYVVFQLDNRGTAARGTAFQAPIHGKLGEIEVADQILGAEWLGSLPYVDAKRIGVWGWSYGGYMTLMLMCKSHGLFSAGAAGAPVTDWTLYDTHYTERYLDRPQENANGYAASSVLPYAKDLAGKLLLMHGMADDNVLFLHSTKLMRRLQDLGKAFDVMVYPGAKHGLMRQHDGRHAYATILKFFDEALRPTGAGVQR